ncbi:MAG: metal-sensing transcriptional repressor [Sphingomonadales bacterium]|nr:metal-sensing transcriptional repressor [Sphingomonadales bacterium]MDE2172137.1 metal-sensing transcriptional repressor [Sphingomonadales bacterium]
MSHATDKDLINRLRRANGHLAKIIAMIAEDRSALDIAQQLQAVIAALDKAKTNLVAHHIEHHLTETLGELTPEARETLGRLTEIAKYL